MFVSMLSCYLRCYVLNGCVYVVLLCAKCLCLCYLIISDVMCWMFVCMLSCYVYNVCVYVVLLCVKCLCLCYLIISDVVLNGCVYVVLFSHPSTINSSLFLSLLSSSLNQCDVIIVIPRVTVMLSLLASSLASLLIHLPWFGSSNFCLS